MCNCCKRDIFTNNLLFIEIIDCITNEIYYIIIKYNKKLGYNGFIVNQTELSNKKIESLDDIKSVIKILDIELDNKCTFKMSNLELNIIIEINFKCCKKIKLVNLNFDDLSSSYKKNKVKINIVDHVSEELTYILERFNFYEILDIISNDNKKSIIDNFIGVYLSNSVELNRDPNQNIQNMYSLINFEDFIYKSDNIYIGRAVEIEIDSADSLTFDENNQINLLSYYLICDKNRNSFKIKLVKGLNHFEGYLDDVIIIDNVNSEESSIGFLSLSKINFAQQFPTYNSLYEIEYDWLKPGVKLVSNDLHISANQIDFTNEINLELFEELTGIKSTGKIITEFSINIINVEKSTLQNDNIFNLKCEVNIKLDNMTTTSKYIVFGTFNKCNDTLKIFNYQNIDRCINNLIIDGEFILKSGKFIGNYLSYFDNKVNYFKLIGLILEINQ